MKAWLLLLALSGTSPAAMSAATPTAPLTVTSAAPPTAPLTVTSAAPPAAPLTVTSAAPPTATPTSPPSESHFAWPLGVRAAVSLAYDDALDSQLDHAVPALDKYGLKASFYLTLSSPSLARRLPQWRALAARGFELGNHTLFHQCSHSAPGREWVTPEHDLERTSAAQMIEQVRVGNAMLQAIDGNTERTFTVPCGDRLAAGTDYVQGLHGDFLAIKSGAGGVVADMQGLDVYAVGVTAPSNVTGKQLIALVEQARARGTMINFTFHGIGGDYLTVDSPAHEQLLAWLAAHRAEVWTDTFINLMHYVKVQQARATAGAKIGTGRAAASATK